MMASPVNRNLFDLIEKKLQQKEWFDLVDTLKILVNSNLKQSELTQWIQALAEIYYMLGEKQLADEKARDLTLKANDLLIRLFNDHVPVLTAEHYLELSISMLACKRLDESAAFLGSALKQTQTNAFYESYMAALLFPIQDQWREEAAEYAFNLLDQFIAKSQLIQAWLRLHANAMTHYQKSVCEKILEAKESEAQCADKKAFAHEVKRGMDLVHRFINYGKYEVAKKLLDNIINHLEVDVPLRKQWDETIKQYYWCASEKQKLPVNTKSPVFLDTLQEECARIAKARKQLKETMEQTREPILSTFITSLNTYRQQFFAGMEFILKQLTQRLDSIIGPAPCAFALIVGGSHGRGDMQLYSDLEPALLIEDEAHSHHPYFKAVFALFHTRLLMLGEPWGYNGGEFHCQGFHIDGGNLKFMQDLIQTPKKLANWIVDVLTDESNDLEAQKILANGLCYAELLFRSQTEFDVLSLFQTQLAYQITLRKQDWKKVQATAIEQFRQPVTLKLDHKTILKAIARIIFAIQGFEHFNYSKQLETTSFVDPQFNRHLVDCWMYTVKQRILNQQEPAFLSWVQQTLFIPFYQKQNLLELPTPYSPWKAYSNQHDSLAVYVASCRYGQYLDLPATQIQPLWDKTLSFLLERLPKEWTPCTHEEWRYPDSSFTVKELLSALIFHGANPDTTPSLVDTALQKNSLGWLLLLLTSGAGRCVQTPVQVYIDYFKQASSQWQPLIESTLTQWANFNSNVNWFMAKQLLFASSECHVQGVESGEVSLNPKIMQQLKLDPFKANLKIEKENSYGRRSVMRIPLNQRTFFWKFYPEAPAIEDAVQQLAHSYFPNTIPHSELIRFDQDKKCIPILISEAIEGYNLQDIMNALSPEPKAHTKALEKGIDLELAKECIQQIDHYSFSLHVLLTLFTNDEDGKPDNKYLVPFQQGNQKRYRIVSIDNDHSFLSPITLDEKGRKTLQLKSIILCLDNMKRSLHPQAVSEFLKQNPYDSIEQWLNKLIERQGRYFKLFDGPNEKDINATRTELLKKDVMLQLIFPKRSIAKLWEKWTSAQTYLTQHPTATGLKLLRQVMPEVALYYTEAFKKLFPIDRFNFVAHKSYTSVLLGKMTVNYGTTTQSTQLLTAQGVKKESFAQKDHGLGPKASLEELKTIQSEHTQLEAHVKRLMQGHFEPLQQLYLDNSKAALISVLDWNRLTIDQQKTLLNIMITEGLNAHGLTLKNCSVLNDDKLESLLRRMPALKHLTLIQTDISGKFWELLATYCNSIQTLTLENLPHLAQPGAPLLPELTELNLKMVPSLTKLRLQTPNLKKLVVQDAPKLIEIMTQSVKLETFILQATPQLGVNGMANSFETLSSFKQGQLPEAWQNKPDLALYCTYPFLLSKQIYPNVERFSEDCLKLLKNSSAPFSSEVWLTLKQLVQAHSHQLMLNELIQPELTKRLKDSKESIRQAANATLQLIQQPNSEVPALSKSNMLKASLHEATLPELLAHVKRGDKQLRRAASEALGQSGNHANYEMVIWTLVGTLHDPSKEVREAAAQSLGQSCNATMAEAIIPVILNDLSNPNFEIRQTMALALGCLEEKAANELVLNLLLEGLSDPEKGVRQTIAETLGKLMAVTAVEATARKLFTRLKDDSEWVRLSTVHTFYHFAKQVHYHYRLQCEKLEIKKSNVQNAMNFFPPNTENTKLEDNNNTTAPQLNFG